MRSRSRSISCKSREEFLEKSKEAEVDKKIYHNRRKRDYDEFKMEFDDEYEEGLKSNCSYQLEEKVLSIDELEKLEENQLYSIINEINKISNEDSDLLEESGLSHNYMELSTENDDDQIGYPEEKDYIGLSKKIKENPSMNGNIPKDLTIDQNFLKQNIVPYTELLKIIVLGDDKSGKTSFIKSLTQHKSNSNLYEHTLSLEILKTLVSFKNKNIQIEFFDTNDKILNSNILNVYYQFSNGVIYIINPNNFLRTDYKLYLKQLYSKIRKIKEITKCSTKISLAINETEFNKTATEEEKKQFLRIINEIKEELIDDTNTSMFVFNLSNFNINNSSFKDFFVNIFENRLYRKSI